MKCWTRNLLLAALLVLLAIPSVAQINSATRGGIGGLVTDQAGGIMPNVTVEVIGPQGTYKATTDQTGRYEVNGLVPL